MEVVKIFCRGGALLRPCRRNWFYDNFRRIRIVLRADAGIGPYGAKIRKVSGGAEPRPYNLPRKKVAPIKISVAPSIDSSCSKATSCKFETPVSGGAYQDAREVTIVWNARPKYRFLPEFRGRKHQTVTKRPFLPYLFPRKGKDRAAGGNRQLQICNNLSVSATPSQLPWKGSQGVRAAGSAAEVGNNLSVSLRLPAPLEGEPLVKKAAGGILRRL